MAYIVSQLHQNQFSYELDHQVPWPVVVRICHFLIESQETELTVFKEQNDSKF